ncbi:MAG: FUSC family protein, partial [Bacteroidales bacterium]|nr:FUSC family protein [Bacteroidales bacterium]
MNAKTKFKEAFKIGLSFAIVYGIALKMNWLNPYWAGWAVVMVALPTSGQSIQKSLLRISGTIPGAIGALIILTIAPQQRWLFLFLLSGWTFFTTYMMLTDKKHSYAWFVMGYVAMIVMLTGPSSSYNLFMSATFRVVENVLGMSVYLLVTIFIWPVTNSGAVKKSAQKLVATHAKIFSVGYSKTITKDEKKYLEKLHVNEIQLLDQLKQAIDNEVIEDYEVQEVKHLWEHFNLISISIMKIMNRWQTGYDEFKEIDINSVLPDYEVFRKEINERFDTIQK